jgi:hypothetical protein
LERAGEIVKRALDYPYEAPRRSFVQLGDRTLIPPPRGPDLSDREPLLAYGANAAPQALGRKLAALPDEPLPVLRAELEGYDVVYSAHVSAYGAVPATLHPSPGTTLPLFVAYPTEEQRALLTATEPNYELVRLARVALRVDGVGELSAVDAYVSRHGPLSVDGAEVALAAVAAAGRLLAPLEQAAVLERVRAKLAADVDLERFVLSCTARGGLAPLPRLGAD